MKYRYKKNVKLSYAGKQYHTGALFNELPNDLPIEWFEAVEIEEKIELKPKIKRKKEVDIFGNSTNSDSDLER